MALQRLIFMRHAKSSWDDPLLDDHERPLNDRGRRDAPRIAEALHAKGWTPETICTSTAQRTLETAELLMRALPGPQTVIRVPDFYHASADTVLNWLCVQDEPNGTLLLLGHNPGWSSLVEVYGGGVQRMPTAACAVFARSDEGTHWWHPESWRLIDILRPKQFR